MQTARTTHAALKTPTRWDRIGIMASAVCAVHCTLLPLLVAVVPMVGLSRLLEPRLEWLFMVSAALIGVIGHGRAYRHNHRHVVPGVIFVIGFSLVVVGRFLTGPRWAEPCVLGLGGMLAAASHYANLRFCRCCPTCGE